MTPYFVFSLCGTPFEFVVQAEFWDCSIEHKTSAVIAVFIFPKEKYKEDHHCFAVMDYNNYITDVILEKETHTCWITLTNSKDTKKKFISKLIGLLCFH